MFYRKALKPLLFSLHPDYAHALAGTIGSLLGKSRLSQKLLNNFFVYRHPVLETGVCGIKFKNPIGLAGGFDKECKLIQTIPHIGFGFMEVGSITHKPYGGNKRPWSTRVREEKSILVNYGLKNCGAEVARNVIERSRRECPLIINIAKTNDPLIKGKASIADYMRSFMLLEPLADLVNLNISCPNSGDGTLLCENDQMLHELLSSVQKQVDYKKSEKPIFVKIKADMEDSNLSCLVRIVKSYPCIKGFIISNLSGNRGLLNSSQEKYSNCKGGISGQPIRQISTEMIRKVYRLTCGRYPIIGVGGVFSAEDAYEKIKAGASLIELITGMIYEGPGLIKKINQGLVELLQKDGFNSVAEAVGKDNN